MSDEDQAIPKQKIWSRITDRTKWPRSWWQPTAGSVLPYDDEKLQHQTAEEILRTIRRVMLTLVGYCFFCWLTLGAPDASLIDATAKIKIPFANVEIEFVSFLVIGPLVTIAIWGYLQIFVGLLEAMQRNDAYHPFLPFIFSLKHPVPRLASRVLLYWLAPFTVAVFAWKALPRAEAPLLIALAAAFIAVSFWLTIARRPARNRGLWGVGSWIGLLVAIVIGIDALASLSIFHDRLFQFSRSMLLARVDLSKQDLRVTNLSNANLREANLSGAILFNANLRGANLILANLERANLRRADLRDTRLFGANLVKARMDGARLNGADLRRADFGAANLRGARFINAKLARASFLNVNLQRADLRGVDLSRVELTNAYLLSANLSGAKLSSTNLRGVNLGGAYLANTDLTRARMDEVKGLTTTQLKKACVRGGQPKLPAGMTVRLARCPG